MPPPRHPSRLDTITFPVFACSWYGRPSLPPSNVGGLSILAYCGGGGSAKTGVFNKLAVQVREQLTPDENRTGDGVCERLLKIDTGEQIGVGVAMHRHHSNRGDARMLVCVGDKVVMYAVPLDGSPLTSELPDDDDADAGPALLLGDVTVGPKYGCNAVAFSPLGDAMTVGCENGRVLIYRILHDARTGRATFKKIIETADSDSGGHDKAVSSVAFHPRVVAVLSGAKDGTARLWDGRTGSELGRMVCVAEDIDPKKAAKAAAALKKAKRGRAARGPPKILVRGCAFGDLEGKVVYTVASGQRTPAYLSKWVIAPLKPGEPSPRMPVDQDGQPTGAPPPPSGNYVENARVECSEKPVSALSLSGDASTLVLGNVEGTVYLFDLERMKVGKAFREVHDLPVTCVAARPVPSNLALPGDNGEGVEFDAVCASADNKMGYLTRQRRSRKKKARTASGGGGGSKMGSMSNKTFMVLVWFVLFLYLVAKMSWRVCRPELEALGALESPAASFEGAAMCVYQTVIWAPSTRAGVAVPPH